MLVLSEHPIITGHINYRRTLGSNRPYYRLPAEVSFRSDRFFQNIIRPRFELGVAKAARTLAPNRSRVQLAGCYFLAAFLFAAHLAFIISDSFFRPAAVIPRR